MKKDSRPKKSARARTERPRRLRVVAAWIVLLAGCAGAALWWRGHSSHTPQVYVPKPRGQLTFNKNIAPVVFEHCAGCHRPDNPARQRQLEMLCYPNQALSSRHTIVRAIKDKQMPPPSTISGASA